MSELLRQQWVTVTGSCTPDSGLVTVNTCTVKYWLGTDIMFVMFDINFTTGALGVGLSTITFDFSSSQLPPFSDAHAVSTMFDKTVVASGLNTQSFGKVSLSNNDMTLTAFPFQAGCTYVVDGQLFSNF